MRRITLTTVVVCLTLVGVAYAASGPKATGGVNFTPVNDGLMESQHLSFTAQPDRSGAKGNVNSRAVAPDGSLGLAYKGKVDCYFQAGNRAWFSGETGPQQGTRANPARRFFVWVVEDNGEPSSDSSPDRINGTRRVLEPDCRNDPLMPIHSAESGNIQVHAGG